MMNAGIQIVIVFCVSLAGVNLQAQHFGFDYDNFGGNIGAVSSASAFASSSIVFNNGGFVQSSEANSRVGSPGLGVNNRGGANKRGAGNAAQMEFANNPFLHDAAMPHPPKAAAANPARPTKKKPAAAAAHPAGPTKKKPPAAAHPAGPTKKKPAAGAAAMANKNKKKKNNAAGKKRVSQIKYDQYLASIFPDMDHTEDVTDLTGRELARPGEFPHMGAIGFRNTVFNKTEYKCGASLISNSYALTSAHCTEFNGLQPNYVRFGDLNLKAAEEDVDPQTRKIAKIINHPDYNDDSLYNDIALLQLEKPVIFTEFVRPIRLWYRDEVPFTNAFAMGFGAIEFAGAATNRLTEFNLTIIPNEVCATQFPKQSNLKEGIVDSQICAIDLRKTGSDTFQGDSGGPLQISFYGRRRGRLHNNLIGITSFGLLGLNRRPGVYTRISYYVDWIEGIVWSDEYYNY